MTSPAGLQVTGRTRRTGPARGGEPAAGFSLAAAVDGLTEFAVLAFASWTLWYDIGAVAHLRTSLLLALWAACLVAIAVGLLRAGWAGGPPAADSGQPGLVAHWLAGLLPWRRPLGVASVILGVAAGLAVGLHHVGLSWAWTWALGVPAVAATLAWLLLPDAEAPKAARPPADAPPAATAGFPAARAGSPATTPAGSPTPAPAGSSAAAPAAPAAQGGSLLALGTAVAAAIFSLYIVRPDADDAYFVSRAVWTAQHGRIPLRDVIFTNQAVKAVAGETPVSSVEVLIGALARLFNVPAATVTYEIALPVFTFVAVWAVWMLIRRWAPRRYALCFTVAMAYLAWSGTSPASLGSFHLVRMWQGKAAFVSLMVPLLYFYLTRWAEHRSRRSLLLVVAAGIAAAGLTSSAALVVPLIVAAVAVPLLLAGQITAALGALLAAAYPVVAGLVVAAYYPLNVPGPPFTAPAAWAWVLLTGVLGGITGLALWTAPRLARRGVPALILAGVAGVVTVLMIPGVLARIGAATGANAVLWRTMWVVPGPAAVGLLAAVPLPSAVRLRSTTRWAAAVPAGALCAVIVMAGLPVWSPQNLIHAIVAREPSWKYDPFSLHVASRVLRADHQPGDLLSTTKLMGAVPLLTSEIQAVDARTYYLELMPVSGRFINDRLLLTRLASQTAPMPSEPAVRAALAAVPVGYACVWSHNTAGLQLLTQAGFAPVTHFGTLQCLQR